MNRKPAALGPWSWPLEKLFRSFYFLKGKKATKYRQEQVKFTKKRGAPIDLPAMYPGKWPDVSQDRDVASLLRAIMPASLHEKYRPEFCTGVDLNRNFPYQWAVSYLDLAISYVYVLVITPP